MRVFAISVISDVGGADISPNVSHEEVLEAVNNAMPNVITIVKDFVKKFK